MGRELEKEFANDEEVVGLLNDLINKGTDKYKYADTMYNLGKAFGKILLPKISGYPNINLASTVEDADYLAKGVIDVLEQKGQKVFLTVFWNNNFKPNEENGIAIAPIIKEFNQKNDAPVNLLIIVKSIISSSCVVRTNLTRLIEKSTPDHIFVVAPVLLKGAIGSLKSEFDNEISQKFEYLYFAVDDERTEDGLVQPGIGGNIYNRLGFSNQMAKNRYIPDIVKQRRY